MGKRLTVLTLLFSDVLDLERSAEVRLEGSVYWLDVFA